MSVPPGWRLIPAHAGKTRHSSMRTIIPRAHPRSRGENSLRGGRPRGTRGSSPLTRGKPYDSGWNPTDTRLIPAHAGKTGCRLPRGSGVRAHPRSRGENSTAATGLWRLLGSSPLTRGKRIAFAHDLLPVRLIPAHAGKTAPRSHALPDPAAHPRSRGENTWRLFMAQLSVGSSPLTRGKHRAVVLRQPTGRLIPAHAGKTPRPTASSTPTPAHPRSRGENT